MSICTVDGRAVVLTDPPNNHSNLSHQTDIKIDSRILSASQLEQIQLDCLSPSATTSPNAIVQVLLDHALAINSSTIKQSSWLQQKHSTELTNLSEMYENEKLDILKQGLALKKKLSNSSGTEGREINRDWNGPIGGQYGQYELYKRGAGVNYGPGNSETEMEIDNRLLKSDVRFLKHRVKESDVQVLRMEAEIKQLRACLLSSAPFITIDKEIVYAPPSLPSSNSTSSHRLAQVTPPESSQQAHRMRNRTGLMGDAEAEHLLLAGKKLSHIRRIERIPLTQALLTNAEQIVAGRDGYVFEGLPEKNEEVKARMRKVTIDSTTKTPPASPVKARATSAMPTTPGARSPKKVANPATKPTTPRRMEGMNPEAMSPGKASGAAAVPGAGGIFDALRGLVEAAVSLTPGREREEDWPELESPKRQKFNADHPRAPTSLQKPPPPPQIDVRLANGGGGGSSSIYRASPVASGSNLGLSAFNGPPSAGGANLGSNGFINFNGPPSANSNYGFPNYNAPLSAGYNGPPSGNSIDYQSALEVLAETASSQTYPPGKLLPGFSPQNSFLPNGGPIYFPPPPNPYLLQPQQMQLPISPFKRPRSPYIRWEKSEDELLVKAIIANGQRWDNVALHVPSRSYHQVRQRWIRGLKSGDALPDELKHLQGAVKEAIRSYEAARAKNKTKVVDNRIATVDDSEEEVGEESR